MTYVTYIGHNIQKQRDSHGAEKHHLNREDSTIFNIRLPTGSSQTIQIIPSVQLDHSALKLNFCTVQNEARGRGYWKFNNSLIQDKEFVEAMKNATPNFLESASFFDDPMMKWESVKHKCRDISRKITIEKSRERKSRLVELENRLAEQENIITTNSSQEVITEYS